MRTPRASRKGCQRRVKLDSQYGERTALRGPRRKTGLGLGLDCEQVAPSIEHKSWWAFYWAAAAADARISHDPCCRQQVYWHQQAKGNRRLWINRRHITSVLVLCPFACLFAAVACVCLLVCACGLSGSSVCV